MAASKSNSAQIREGAAEGFNHGAQVHKERYITNRADAVLARVLDYQAGTSMPMSIVAVSAAHPFSLSDQARPELPP